MKNVAICSLLFWVCLYQVWAQENITFYPREPVQVLPGRFGTVQPVAILIFALEPETLGLENFTATWTLQNGEMASEASQSLDVRFFIQQGLVAPAQGQTLPGTTLLIQALSYSDAGMYICSVQDNRNLGNPPIQATIELQLTLTLTGSNVTTTDNASSVELICDMSDYIRPDNQLQWYRGDQLITSGQDRRQITFRNGTRDGQIGGLQPGLSRESVLTISNPVSSDSEVYTCRVLETTQSVDIHLLVQESTTENTMNPPTSSPVTTNLAETSTNAQTSGTTMSTLSGDITTVSMEATQDSFPLPAVIGGIAGFLALIVIMLVIVIAIVSLKRRDIVSKSASITPNDFQENGAYASASNGGSHTGSLAIIPNFTKIEKTTPPPLPARPSTNLSSMSAANSINSFEPEPPGYATPELPNWNDKYNPYYDDPNHLKPRPEEKFIAPPPRRSNPKGYYDDVHVADGANSTAGTPNPYDMTSVPSPAAILSGSMPRRNNPDFSYPIYNTEIPISDLNTDHDYDQIYSEPIDPTLIQSDFEFDAGSQEAIPYSAIYEDPLPLQEGVAPLVVTYNNIQEVKNLGMGQFGNVILARTIGLSLKDLKLSDTDTDRNISILVAIKKLKMNAESSLTANFNKEVKFMARLMHDNVIRLLGVCKGAESFIMMEYMENGDLNQFLQKQRLMPDTISGLQENEVTPIILLYIGVQIASGMHYLASHRFVHRDLATRNCLVGKDFVVKISDFGMSRSLYESAYYRVQGTLVLPIRWMACETFYGKFSVKSDAWAFGVVLWEIYTLGKIDPYDHMTDEEVIADAIRGPDRVLPIKPEYCPLEVYDIMLRCWVHEPSMRADFGEIYSRLFLIYTRQAL